MLDEADHLTKDAQNALRRIIEDFTKVTRFVLICNYITKIIEPLNSRCMKFRFHQISRSTQIQRLRNICTHEKLKYRGQALEYVVDISGGDLRKGLNLLQMASATTEPGSPISKEDVSFISDVLPSEDVFGDYIDKYLGLRMKSKKTAEKEKMDFVDRMMGEGVTAQQFIKAVHGSIRRRKGVGSLERARVVVALTEAEESVLTGVNDFTVLSLLLAQIEDIFN